MGAWLSLLFVPPSKVVSLQGRKLIIKKSLGEGGFSFVYLVKDIHENKIYALKKMLCQTEELLNTGRKEIEILGKFQHPNILGIIAHDIVPSRTVKDAKDVLMLIPYHKRGTLQDALDFQRKRFGNNCTTSPFTEHEVLTIFRGICSAVAAFHQADPPLALRDIKPGNVLLSEKNEPVLMDFGSVCEARVKIANRQQALSIQEITDQLSTPLYRAPELFNIESDCVLDERTDIWSLGGLLYLQYSLVYCHSPFESSSSVALAVTSNIMYPRKVQFPHSGSVLIKYPRYPQTTFSSQTIDLIKSMLVVDAGARPFLPDVLNRLPSSAQESQ